MSVAGISATPFSSPNTQNVTSQRQEFKQTFKQLGEDLKSGDLDAAKADFAQLQKLAPQRSANSSGRADIGQQVQQLKQDLASGNLAGAQSDYGKLSSDFKTVAAHARHHHASPSATAAGNTISVTA